MPSAEASRNIMYAFGPRPDFYDEELQLYRLSVLLRGSRKTNVVRTVSLDAAENRDDGNLVRVAEADVVDEPKIDLEDEEDVPEYKCELCCKFCSSVADLETHQNGKRHKHQEQMETKWLDYLSQLQSAS